MPDWTNNKVLQITKQEDRDVELTYSKHGAPPKVAKFVPEPDDAGPWRLSKNFSMHMAEIVSDTHSYQARSLFPEKARLLQRTFSDEVGATGVVSSEAHDEMKKTKKGKAKAKASQGKVSLGTPSKNTQASPSHSPAPSVASEEREATWEWHDGKLCKVLLKDGKKILEPNTGLTFRERFQVPDSKVDWDAENDVLAPDYPPEFLQAWVRSELKRTSDSASGPSGQSTPAGSASGGGAPANVVAGVAEVGAVAETAVDGAEAVAVEHGVAVAETSQTEQKEDGAEVAVAEAAEAEEKEGEDEAAEAEEKEDEDEAAEPPAPPPPPAELR